MILGFYYHSAFCTKNNKHFVPGYIGVFIDSIANQVDKLYLFLEEQPNPHSTEEDYELISLNIVLINLGAKSTFYKRLLKPESQLNVVDKYINLIDAFLVRMPTPLGPNLIDHINKIIPIYTLLVGNYTKGLKDLKQPFFRKIGISILTYYYQYIQNKTLKNRPIFVNSGELLKDNRNISDNITLIKTTTLSKGSFYQRVYICIDKTIKILYTGRINFQKGLRELIQSIAELSSKYTIELHVVGWEEAGTFSYQKELENMAMNLGISNQIHFHGKKKIGPELDAYYRMADIYVIPSYHEGFPRTIWEAMANSLPVIATSVGSIPYYLKHNETAFIIEPKNKKAITDAIETVIENKSLRQKLIKQAFELSQEVTLEHQSELLISKIKKLNNE